MRDIEKEYAPLSEVPTGCTIPPIKPRDVEVPMLHNVTKQSISKMNDLGALRQTLASVRASLTDSLCWERQLEAELIEAKAERKHWSDLQTQIIIRQAELSGLVKKVPHREHATTPTYTRSSLPKSEQMKMVLDSLSHEERASFIQELLASVTCNCAPKEPSGISKSL